MKRHMTVLAASMLMCFLASCEKEEKKPEATPAPSAQVAPAPVATAVPAPAETIPVSADFEEEAEKSITAANYKKELDSLEAEIK